MNPKKWPIVRFAKGETSTIHAICRVSEMGDKEPYSLLSRTQIPLLAAWALTVHRSQGMTLDRVIVDLGRAFAEGQVYVALSRARGLYGLTVRSLSCRRIAANAQVKEFLRSVFHIKELSLHAG